MQYSSNHKKIVTLVSATNKDLQPTPRNRDSFMTSSFPRNIISSTLKVPQGVSHIAEGAFVECQNMKELYLPESIQQINDSTLALLPKLNLIVIESDKESKVKRIKSLFSTPYLKRMVMSKQELIESIESQFSKDLELYMLENFPTMKDLEMHMLGTVPNMNTLPTEEISVATVPTEEIPVATAPTQQKMQVANSWASFFDNIFVTRTVPDLSEMRSMMAKSMAESETNNRAP